jgi:hypothetical protein
MHDIDMHVTSAALLCNGELVLYALTVQLILLEVERSSLLLDQIAMP